jgi:hypothetical protein
MLGSNALNIIYGIFLVGIALTAARNPNLLCLMLLLLLHKFIDVLALNPDAVTWLGQWPVSYFAIVTLGDIILFTLIYQRNAISLKLGFVGMHTRFIRYPHEFIFMLLVAITLWQDIYVTVEVSLFRQGWLAYEALFGYHSWEYIKRTVMALEILILCKLAYDHYKGRLLVEHHVKL